MNSTANLLNRFGLGARPEELAPTDAQRWFVSQADAYEPLPAPWRQVSRTPKLLEAWLAQQRAARQAPEGERAGVREAYLRHAREDYVAAVGARASSALQTATPFVERLVHFWANHFAVSVDKLLVLGVAGALEADAIRPHVLGRFEDMLLAVVRHPAMLLYLDQAQSIGPGSTAGRRSGARAGEQRRRGLNENLAREILELHTLGVRSGYTQEDVSELARALTGWTLPGDDSGRDAATTFRFVPALHEPGARTVLGRKYPDDGEKQARAILHDLALAPATARHLAFKLARHFVADDPPAALVKRLAEAFLRKDGDLPTVYRELLAAPEARQPASSKFKTPWEWAISGLRALSREEVAAARVAGLMTQLAQPVWRPGSPAGYDDVAATWAAPDALLRRIEAAQRLAAQWGGAIDARQLARRILPDTLSETTASAIGGAESGTTAVALLLVSPEFLRR
jgi:uncharacterized protein (DUF1800 family)